MGNVRFGDVRMMKEKKLPIGALWSGRSGSPGAAGVFEVGPAGGYLKTQWATATPKRLQILLYDGAVRLSRQALRALDEGDTRLATDKLSRAGAILAQLQRTLETGDSSALSRRLSALFGQVNKHLLQGRFYRSRQEVDETISMLVQMRGLWVSSVEVLSQSSSPTGTCTSQLDWIA